MFRKDRQSIMGNLCSTPSSPKKSSSMELNPKSNISPAPVMVNNALVAKTHDHTMVLGSDTPEPPEPVITGPTVVLLPHQHTLFCERKVCFIYIFLSQSVIISWDNYLATCLYCCWKSTRIRKIESI